MKLARSWKILSYSPVSNIITLCSIECNSCQKPHGSKQLLFVHYFIKLRGTWGKRKVHFTKFSIVWQNGEWQQFIICYVIVIQECQMSTYQPRNNLWHLNKKASETFLINRSLQHPLLNFFFARSLLNLVTFWLRYISPKSFYGLRILWVMMVTESNNRILH